MLQIIIPSGIISNDVFDEGLKEPVLEYAVYPWLRVGAAAAALQQLAGARTTPLLTPRQLNTQLQYEIQQLNVLKYVD